MSGDSGGLSTPPAARDRVGCNEGIDRLATRVHRRHLCLDAMGVSRPFPPKVVVQCATGTVVVVMRDDLRWPMASESVGHLGLPPGRTQANRRRAVDRV